MKESSAVLSILLHVYYVQYGSNVKFNIWSCVVNWEIRKLENCMCIIFIQWLWRILIIVLHDEPARECYDADDLKGFSLINHQKGVTQQTQTHPARMLTANESTVRVTSSSSCCVFHSEWCGNVEFEMLCCARSTANDVATLGRPPTDWRLARSLLARTRSSTCVQLRKLKLLVAQCG